MAHIRKNANGHLSKSAAGNLIIGDCCCDTCTVTCQYCPGYDPITESGGDAPCTIRLIFDSVTLCTSCADLENSGTQYGQITSGGTFSGTFDLAIAGACYWEYLEDPGVTVTGEGYSDACSTVNTTGPSLFRIYCERIDASTYLVCVAVNINAPSRSNWAIFQAHITTDCLVGATQGNDLVSGTNYCGEHNPVSLLLGCAENVMGMDGTVQLIPL